MGQLKRVLVSKAPTAGKVFVSPGFTTITDISAALEGLRNEELYEEGGGSLGKVKD